MLRPSLLLLLVLLLLSTSSLSLAALSGSPSRTKPNAVENQPAALDGEGEIDFIDHRWQAAAKEWGAKAQEAAQDWGGKVGAWGKVGSKKLKDLDLGKGLEGLPKMWHASVAAVEKVLPERGKAPKLVDRSSVEWELGDLKGGEARRSANGGVSGREGTDSEEEGAAADEERSAVEGRVKPRKRADLEGSRQDKPAGERKSEKPGGEQANWLAPQTDEERDGDSKLAPKAGTDIGGSPTAGGASITQGRVKAERTVESSGFGKKGSRVVEGQSQLEPTCNIEPAAAGEVDVLVNPTRGASTERGQFGEEAPERRDFGRLETLDVSESGPPAAVCTVEARSVVEFEEWSRKVPKERKGSSDSLEGPRFVDRPGSQGQETRSAEEQEERLDLVVLLVGTVGLGLAYLIVRGLFRSFWWAVGSSARRGLVGVDTGEVGQGRAGVCNDGLVSVRKGGALRGLEGVSSGLVQESKDSKDLLGRQLGTALGFATGSLLAEVSCRGSFVTCCPEGISCQFTTLLIEIRAASSSKKSSICILPMEVALDQSMGRN
jgi:hypothetical protein